ncbi:MAG: GyrI-like domain-containing protein [Planctomycetota bacterium]|jgi:hypothetical protein
MAKLDLKKQFKHLYAPARKPVIVDVPEMLFIMIDGEGDPNTSPDFQDAMQTLFPVAYSIKFALKKSDPAKDFTVMPPEGLWWMKDGIPFSLERKGDWLWTLMIMQPDFVTPEILAAVSEDLRRKGKAPALEKARLETYREGQCVQMLHVGSYDTEPATVGEMHALAAEANLEFHGKHHEIYLSDPRRTAPEKLKTILRHPLRPKACNDNCPGRQIQGMY